MASRLLKYGRPAKGVTAMQISMKPGTKNAIRTLHCISACGWIGGGLAVLILLKLAGTPAGQAEAEAFQRSIIAIDDFLIVPSAGVSTFSGLLLCCLKPWGFSGHRWIIEKCILTFLLLVFGAFWLAPDLQSLVPQGFDPLESDLLYRHHWLRSSAAALIQTIGLLLLVGLSVVKPEKAKAPHFTAFVTRSPKLHPKRTAASARSKA
jgi:hypothetical protein